MLELEINDKTRDFFYVDNYFYVNLTYHVLVMRKPVKISTNQKRKIQKMIGNILQKEKQIHFSYLHGSFLENMFRDIDIGIYIDKNLSKKKQFSYELSLEKKLQNIVSYPVDVRILNHAPLSFSFSVIKNGIILFSKDENKRIDFETRIFSKYHDFEFYRKRYRREALGIHL